MKSKRGQWSKAQRAYVSRVVADGCIACRKTGLGPTPAAWHEKELDAQYWDEKRRLADSTRALVSRIENLRLEEGRELIRGIVGEA